MNATEWRVAGDKFIRQQVRSFEMTVPSGRDAIRSAAAMWARFVESTAGSEMADRFYVTALARQGLEPW